MGFADVDDPNACCDAVSCSVAVYWRKLTQNAIQVNHLTMQQDSIEINSYLVLC